MADLVEENGQTFLIEGSKKTPVKAVKTPDGKTYIKFENGVEAEFESAPEAYSPGAYDYAQQVLGQGTLMGFGDEIAGGIRG